MNNLAPIVLFVYNRPEHTRATLQALSENALADQSSLFIFADGAKNSSEELLRDIEATQAVLKERQWCKEVTIFASEINKGLANSIVGGVTKIVNQYGKVIVLEDDIVTSKGFLQYMNDALTLYEANEQVQHISGYMYPVTTAVENDTVFLRVLSCWGWGTWKRAWDHYENNVDKYLSMLTDQHAIDRFNVRGNATFYDQLLKNKSGQIKTWAVKWFAAWYFNGGISLFPKTTMVTNIGHDGTGVHCSTNEIYLPNFVIDNTDVILKDIKEDEDYMQLIDQFYLAEKPKVIISTPLQKMKLKIYRLLKGPLGLK